MVPDQFEIALLGRTEHELLGAVHGQVKCSFRDQPPEPLPMVRFGVKLVQVVDVNVKHRRARHRLGVVAARRLRHEAFICHHDLVF